MDITQKAKNQLERRIQRLENFIANKGVGSEYLDRAKTVQRNVNIGLVLTSVAAIAGIAIWALKSSDEDED